MPSRVDYMDEDRKRRTAALRQVEDPTAGNDDLLDTIGQGVGDSMPKDYARPAPVSASKMPADYAINPMMPKDYASPPPEPYNTTREVVTTLPDLAPAKPLSQAPVMPGILGTQAEDAAKRNAVNAPAPVEPSDIEKAAARDRMAGMLRALELGSKQFGAGVGGQPVGELVQGKTNFESEARDRAAKADALARDEAERKRRIAEADRQARRQEEKDAYGKERDAKSDALRREGIAASNANAKATQDLERASLGLRADELGEKREERKTAKQEKADSFRIGFLGSSLVPKSGTADATAANKLREKATAAATVIESLGEMDKAFEALAADPTNVQLRSRIESMSATVAPTINVALGQGAMAQDEYRRMREAIGDPAAGSFWLDALKKNDAAATRARIREARRFMLRSVKAAADSAGYTEAP